MKHILHFGIVNLSIFYFIVFVFLFKANHYLHHFPFDNLVLVRVENSNECKVISFCSGLRYYDISFNLTTLPANAQFSL